MIQSWAHMGSKLQVCQLSEPSGMQHNPTTNLQSPELHWQEQGARTSQETLPWKELEMAFPGNSTSLQAPPAPGDAQLHSQGAQTSSCPIFSRMCASCPISHGTWLSSDPETSWQVPGSLQLCSSTGRSHSLRANKQFP